MAGAGKKTFTAGEVLTASDVNTYLMEQSVMYFGGTAARASAIPTPSTGMTSYIGVTGTATIPQLETYTGSDWQTPYGLTQVANVSFSSVASINIDNVFTSAFANYRLVFDFSVSTNAARTINMQFRTGGSTNSTANYQTCSDGAFPSGGTTKTGSFYGATNSTSLTLIPDAYYANTTNFSFNADVINPQVAKFTNLGGNYDGQTAANLVFGSYGGSFTQTTAMDGFVLFNTSGTFTGIVKVYGYRNS